jgi:hypothetical protein
MKDSLLEFLEEFKRYSSTKKGLTGKFSAFLIVTYNVVAFLRTTGL